jgi:phage tail sheath protein FI
VNAIRVIDGQVRIYGARFASNDTGNWRYITYRDTVNQIASESEKALEQFVFSTIDSRKTLFGSIASALTTIMENTKDKGGVYAMVDAFGNDIDRGYRVDVSDSLNPVTALAEGKISASIGVRVAGVADLITLTITKSSLTTAL